VNKGVYRTPEDRRVHNGGGEGGGGGGEKRPRNAHNDERAENETLVGGRKVWRELTRSWKKRDCGYGVFSPMPGVFRQAIEGL